MPPLLDAALAASAGSDCRVRLTASGGPGGTTVVQGVASFARGVAVLDASPRRQVLLSENRIFARSDRSKWLSVAEGRSERGWVAAGFGLLLDANDRSWVPDPRGRRAVVTTAPAAPLARGQEQAIQWCFLRTPPVADTDRTVSVLVDDLERLVSIEMVLETEPGSAEVANRFEVVFEGWGIPDVTAPPEDAFETRRIRRAVEWLRVLRAR